MVVKFRRFYIEKKKINHYFNGFFNAYWAWSY